MGVGRDLSIICQWTTELIHNVSVKNATENIHVQISLRCANSPSDVVPGVIQLGREVALFWVLFFKGISILTFLVDSLLRGCLIFRPLYMWLLNLCQRCWQRLALF